MNLSLLAKLTTLENVLPCKLSNVLLPLNGSISFLSLVLK